MGICGDLNNEYTPIERRNIIVNRAWDSFLLFQGSRPAHFKVLRTGDASPLHCSPLLRSGARGSPIRNTMK